MKDSSDEGFTLVDYVWARSFIFTENLFTHWFISAFLPIFYSPLTFSQSFRWIPSKCCHSGWAGVLVKLEEARLWMCFWQGRLLWPRDFWDLVLVSYLERCFWSCLRILFIFTSLFILSVMKSDCLNFGL